MEAESAPGGQTVSPRREAQVQSRDEAIEEMASSAAGSRVALYDYFTKQDPSCIKSWITSYNLSNINSFCSILTLIFQVSGHRIDVTAGQFQADCVDEILAQFQDEIENERDDPPYVNLIKDKNHRFEDFWRELSEAMVSCGSLFSANFGSFREWIGKLNQCKIRNIRVTTSYFIFEMVNTLTKTISRNLRETERMERLETKTDAVQAQLMNVSRELRVYRSVAGYLERILMLRSRDLDAQIRILAVQCLTEAAVVCPEDFATIDKVKCIGITLSDAVAKSRRDAARCMERIFREIDNKELWEEMSERFADRIIEMTDDRDNSVVTAALECLFAMSERDMLGDVECDHAADLMGDDSQSIRAAAAKFVFKHFFGSDPKRPLSDFLAFASRFGEQDLSGVVGTLYGMMKCIRNHQDLCDALKDELDDKRAELIARVLLYSCERTIGKFVHIQPESDKKIRKMTTTLLKNLESLIKGWRVNKSVSIALVETARLVDLDTISDANMDHHYQQLLGEVRNTFIRSSDREVFTAAIVSLYEISVGQHSLSQVARRELDRLAVDCTKIDDADSEGSIAKFVAAARLVDVSDGGNLRSRIIEQIEKSSDSGFITDAIECLQYFFRWDISHIRSKPDEKEAYLPVFNKYMEIFTRALEHESTSVRIQGFKALGCLLALSPFLRDDDPIFSDEIVSRFYTAFHDMEPKTDLFDAAQKPIQTHGIDLAYSAHLICYAANEKVQPLIKGLWKELAPYKPISGSECVAAMKHANIDESEMKAAARFMMGKFNATDALRAYFDNPDDMVLPGIIPFLLALTPRDASSLLAGSCQQLEGVIRKLSDGEKLTQKSISALLSKRRVIKEKKRLELKEQEPSEPSSDIEFEEPDESFVRR